MGRFAVLFYRLNKQLLTGLGPLVVFQNVFLRECAHEVTQQIKLLIHHFLAWLKLL